MKKSRNTGAVLVSLDDLVRKQLHDWAPGKEDGSGEDGGPLCLRTLQVFSLLKQTPGTKKEM
jgi:hypothetical protein